MVTNEKSSLILPSVSNVDDGKASTEHNSCLFVVWNKNSYAVKSTDHKYTPAYLTP